jgi:hypothetical protein
MSGSRLETTIAVIPVRDLARSLAFYEESLGFRRRFEYGPYAGVARGPIELHLDGSAPPAGPVTVRIQVSGVDDLYAELQKHDAIDPAEPLETRPFGMRQFSVRDLDRNRLTFCQPTDHASAAEKRRFLIFFTHVDGEAQKLRKEDLPALRERHELWRKETDARERSSLVYLAPAAEARNVRLKPDGALEVSEGTFAGGTEAIGGFTIVEADSLEAAVEIAKRHRWIVGSNEVRELKTPPGLASWIRTTL